ncbi:MAG: S1 RNA-binding domain-containing protein [Pirellulales bacterium]|nr:S1 RNA-binding domain-containing protein [Pirellulales bacterium]
MTSEQGEQVDQTQVPQADHEPSQPQQSQAEQAVESTEKPKRRILIGSERPASAGYRAQPQHRPLSVPRAGDEESADSSPPPEASTAVQSAAPATEQVPTSPPVENAAEESVDPTSEAAISNFDPSSAVAPPPPPSGKPVPAPSRRAPLPEDLERELEQALGDMSLDEIVDAETKSGATAAAGVILERETRHKGRVLSVSSEDIFVELGQRQQGVVPRSQFEEPPEVGTEFEFVVTGFNREDELYHLGLPGAAMEVADWSDIHEGGVVEASITGHNKGGLECKVNNIRGFIPASQISLYRVEDFAEFVGQKMACIVTEAKPEKKNLVLSRRAVLEREKAAAKERFLKEVTPGKTFDGTVRKLMDFGAFVELGEGVDGLVHISKLSWGRVNHPSEVLKEGDNVKVRVEKIDPESGKIGLSMKDLAADPWLSASREYYVGARVTGRVTKIMEFGAFVELQPGVEGLIHISELQHGRTFRVRDIVTDGQELEVQVLSVDPDSRRIGLSLKALTAAPNKEDQKKDEVPEVEDTVHNQQVEELRKQRKKPLKGGTAGDRGGAQFGLKW